MYLCCGAHDVGQPVLLRSPGCRKGPHLDKHEHLYWRMAQKKQEAEKRMQQHELAQLNTQRNVSPIPLQLSGIGTWATMVAPSLYRTTARRTRSRAAFRAHCTGRASCLPGVVTLAAAACSAWSASPRAWVRISTRSRRRRRRPTEVAGWHARHRVASICALFPCMRPRAELYLPTLTWVCELLAC